MQSSRWVLVAARIVILASIPSIRPVAAAQQNASAPSTAQTSPTSTAPTIHVTSRETVVDVTVTDAKGNPVHGLKQSDFTVKEDGKPQPIRSFEESVSEDVREPAKLPPNIYTNQQPPPTSSAVNVLLLDFTNSAPGVSLSCCDRDPTAGPKSLARATERQHQTKQDAMKYLQNMPAGTRVAVLGSSNTGHLRVLQGVTSDPALLSAAVDTMVFDTDAVAFNMETWCTQQERRNRMTLESLSQIAADLAEIKGRKNLLWFTTGIPSITDPAARPSCLSDYSAKLKSAYATLAASQVTVFPIWVRGVPADGDPFGENHAAEELSMESVAEDTGGTAFYNSNDLVPYIAKAVQTGSDFYTLTYVPPGFVYDGRHHTIHLDVDQPGLHLTYRDEYYAEDPSKMTPVAGLTLTTTPPEAHAGDMKAAMSRNMPTSSALLFYVDVEPSTSPAKPTDPPVIGTLDPSFKGKPLTRYAFTYSISAGQLAYTSGPNATHNGSVELDLAAYDADAKLVTGLSQTVTMSLNDTTVANKQPLNFSQQLDLPPGQLFVRVGVLDRSSNKVGTIEIPLKVEKGSAAQKSDAVNEEPVESSAPVLPLAAAKTPPTQNPDAAKEEPIETNATELPLTATIAPTTPKPDAAKDEPRETNTLAQILQRLQENLDQYEALVPSFFCDEHVVSKRSPDPQHESRITDSTFRLKRDPAPDAHGKPVLEESREVKMVNGKPADGAYLSGPTTVTGAFSGGLALVSLSQQACMSYTLKPIKANDPQKPIIVLFTSVRPSEHSEDCIMQEDLSGRVQIDPGTMQIKRLEFHAPYHHITPDIAGVWDFAIDYTSIQLGGKSFWMPAKIDVKMVGLTNYVIRWSLDATYSNYHKLEVTSRILPGSAVDITPAPPASKPASESTENQ